MNADRSALAISLYVGMAGIGITENDELTFETWGRYISVSGAKDEETNQRIADILSAQNSSGKLRAELDAKKSAIPTQ